MSERYRVGKWYCRVELDLSQYQTDLPYDVSPGFRSLPRMGKELDNRRNDIDFCREIGLFVSRSGLGTRVSV